MTDIAELSATDHSVAARAHVAQRSASWSALGIAPVVAIAATVGPWLFEHLDAGQGGEGDLGRLFVLLAPWLAATVLLWSTLPALLAETRGAGLLPYVPGIVVVHIAATLVCRELWGFDGVIVAMAAAPLGFAAASFRLTGVLRHVPAIVAGVVRGAALGVGTYAVLYPLTR
jgi:hypothetical protein